MKLLPFSNNAVFLANWYERMRPPMVLSALLITGIVIFLIGTNAQLHPRFIYDYDNPASSSWTHKRQVPWHNHVFWDLAVAQGLLLLAWSTFSAYKMASRERASGTLDFHRSSPTPKINQVIGLLLGATCLEWIIFLTTLIASCLIAFLGSLPWVPIIKFYTMLILCAALYHTTAILFAVNNTRQNFLFANRTLNAIILYLMFYILFAFGWSSYRFSSFAHLSWAPFYAQMEKDIVGFSHYNLNSSNNYHSPHYRLLYFFFGLPCGSVFLQILTQVPLMILMFTGITRKIAHPEYPLLSKSQLVALTAFFNFLFIGSAYNYLLYGREGSYNHGYQNHYLHSALMTTFLSLSFGLGIVGSLITTPSQLSFLKGLRKAKKLGHAKVAPDSDYSSSIHWLLVFSVIVSVFYFIMALPTQKPLHLLTFTLVIVLSHIIFFSGAYEFFRLSIFHKKAPYFWAGLIILWGLIPVFGHMLHGYTYPLANLPLILTAPSPFQAQMLIDVFNDYGDLNRKGRDLIVVAAINLILAITAQILAYRERQRIKNLPLEI